MNFGLIRSKAEEIRSLTIEDAMMVKSVQALPRRSDDAEQESLLSISCKTKRQAVYPHSTIHADLVEVEKVNSHTTNRLSLQGELQMKQQPMLQCQLEGRKDG